jgi:hypothetical protein
MSIIKPLGSCEFEGCLLPAVGWVEAQWSIADFVRYEACYEHLSEIADGLKTRKIDGYRTWPRVYIFESLNPEEDIRL